MRDGGEVFLAVFACKLLSFIAEPQRSQRRPTRHTLPAVLKDCLKRVGHGATAPEWESRLQPVCGRNRLKPGLLGHCPVDQGTPHAVGPTRIIFSDSLSALLACIFQSNIAILKWL